MAVLSEDSDAPPGLPALVSYRGIDGVVSGTIFPLLRDNESNAGLSGYLGLGGGISDSSASLFPSRDVGFFERDSLASLGVSCCCDVAAFDGVLVRVAGFGCEPSSSVRGFVGVALVGFADPVSAIFV